MSSGFRNVRQAKAEIDEVRKSILDVLAKTNAPKVSATQLRTYKGHLFRLHSRLNYASEWVTRHSILKGDRVVTRKHTPPVDKAAQRADAQFRRRIRIIGSDEGATLLDKMEAAKLAQKERLEIEEARRIAREGRQNRALRALEVAEGSGGFRSSRRKRLPHAVSRFDEMDAEVAERRRKGSALSPRSVVRDAPVNRKGVALTDTFAQAAGMLVPGDIIAVQAPPSVAKGIESREALINRLSAVKAQRYALADDVNALALEKKRLLRHEYDTLNTAAHAYDSAVARLETLIAQRKKTGKNAEIDQRIADAKQAVKDQELPEFKFTGAKAAAALRNKALSMVTDPVRKASIVKALPQLDKEIVRKQIALRKLTREEEMLTQRHKRFAAQVAGGKVQVITSADVQTAKEIPANVIVSASVIQSFAQGLGAQQAHLRAVSLAGAQPAPGPGAKLSAKEVAAIERTQLHERQQRDARAAAMGIVPVPDMPGAPLRIDRAAEAAKEAEDAASRGLSVKEYRSLVRRRKPLPPVIPKWRGMSKAAYDKLKKRDRLPTVPDTPIPAPHAPKPRTLSAKEKVRLQGKRRSVAWHPTTDVALTPVREKPTRMTLARLRREHAVVSAQESARKAAEIAERQRQERAAAAFYIAKREREMAESKEALRRTLKRVAASGPKVVRVRPTMTRKGSRKGTIRAKARSK